MIFYRHPEAFANLRNLYWSLRQVRQFDQAGRRYFYRQIRVERDRLESIGFSAEHVRLYCRWMKSPNNEVRQARVVAFETMLIEFARLQSQMMKPAMHNEVH